MEDYPLSCKFTPDTILHQTHNFYCWNYNHTVQHFLMFSLCLKLFSTTVHHHISWINNCMLIRWSKFQIWTVFGRLFGLTNSFFFHLLRCDRGLNAVILNTHRGRNLKIWKTLTKVKIQVSRKYPMLVFKIIAFAPWSQHINQTQISEFPVLRYRLKPSIMWSL